MSGDSIRIRGAAEHNLRSVDLAIPKGRLVAVTGVSGSGKSSLVFDTLFVEGRRRYMESLGLSGRPGFEALPRPAFESIEGLTPTLSARSTAARWGPRSTVGTITEIHDLLRVLFARAGRPHCHRCGTPVVARSAQEIATELARLPEGTKVSILAPIGRGEDPAGEIDRARREGFVRARVDGAVRDLSEKIELAGPREHAVELVVDRIAAKPGMESRLAGSVELALEAGDGVLSLLFEDGREELRSRRPICPSCRTLFPEPHPRAFSFNSPEGACPACQGLGTRDSEGRSAVCPDCRGARLRPESLAVRLGGATIAEISSVPVGRALDFFDSYRPQGVEAEIVREPVAEAKCRLEFLVEVGLGYLTLDRSAPTLSGGEARRVGLAGQLGSRLSGVTYCLDEPTVGLHSRDVRRLLATLVTLRDLGNTVLVVEHDREAIRRADWAIEFGPGAGGEGGHVVFEGTPDAMAADKASPTGAYLGGRRRVGTGRGRRPPGEERLALSGARTHNLASIDVEIPLGLLVAVSGVSGSGKSSLVADTLLPALAAAKGGDRESALYDSLSGAASIERVVEVEGTPPGRSGRSNPTTYVKAFDEIRRFFSELKESKLRGFTAARFSFNVPGGRCEACQGEGARRIEMQFLPDVEVVCPVCEGRRYNDATLAVRYRALSIADCLELPVDDAIRVFDKVDRIRRRLEPLARVGLGYLRLGQPLSTLSGGEAQRVRLARELSGPPAGPTLYALDEPTQGLHFVDVQRLLAVLDLFVEAGHTVLVVEHSLDMIAAADHVIELGPEAGEGGGRIVARGTPEEIAANPDSPTGRALREERLV